MPASALHGPVLLRVVYPFRNEKREMLYRVSVSSCCAAFFVPVAHGGVAHGGRCPTKEFPHPLSSVHSAHYYFDPVKQPRKDHTAAANQAPPAGVPSGGPTGTRGSAGAAETAAKSDKWYPGKFMKREPSGADGKVGGGGGGGAAAGGDDRGLWERFRAKDARVTNLLSCVKRRGWGGSRVAFASLFSSATSQPQSRAPRMTPPRSLSLPPYLHTFPLPGIALRTRWCGQACEP